MAILMLMILHAMVAILSNFFIYIYSSSIIYYWGSSYFFQWNGMWRKLVLQSMSIFVFVIYKKKHTHAQIFLKDNNQW